MLRTISLVSFATGTILVYRTAELVRVRDQVDGDDPAVGHDEGPEE